MNDKSIVIIGILIGFLVGMSGIATLFNLMSGVISETAAQLSQVSALSTIVLLVVAIILIVKIRIISSLLVGAIIGAVLNIILEVNDIHIVNEIYSAILSMIR
jgi:hypothetical protein